MVMKDLIPRLISVTKCFEKAESRLIMSMLDPNYYQNVSAWVRRIVNDFDIIETPIFKSLYMYTEADVEPLERYISQKQSLRNSLYRCDQRMKLLMKSDTTIKPSVVNM